MARIQSNQTPEVLERYEEVVRLRSLGLSFQQIADRVGYAGRQGAMEAYKQAIKMWGNEAVEEMQDLGLVGRKSRGTKRVMKSKNNSWVSPQFYFRGLQGGEYSTKMTELSNKVHELFEEYTTTHNK